MRVHRARIEYIRKVHPETRRIGLVAEGISRDASPGQFYMVRAGEGHDPFLPRPFTMFRRRLEGDDPGCGADGLEILFQVVGRGTRILSQMAPGRTIDVLGPLGRGWRLKPERDAVLVGGGMGVASLVCLAEELPVGQRQGSWVLLGARTSDRLWCVEELKGCGARVMTIVEEGDHAVRGTVLDLLDANRQEIMRVATTLYACGPAPMLKGVALWALQEGVDCQVSLESPMACGVGVCLGCSVKDSRGAGYLRVCHEGPVMDAEEIDWGAWDGR